MAEPSKKILFLSHSASRNGATILLLHLLRWLREQPNQSFEVLVKGRGELVDEFRAMAPTRIWRSPAFLLGPLPPRWRSWLQPRLETKLLQGLLKGRRFDLVHVNTVANWQHVPLLASRSGSLLWHVHELEYAVRSAMGDDGWRQTFSLARRFVAVSQSVKEALTGKFGVPAEKVDLVHGFVPARKQSAADDRATRDRIRNELGLPADAFVVGGCGTLGWRKGTDLFLQIAHIIRQKGGREIRFVWVGGGTKGEEALQFAYDLGAMGLKECCKWIPNTAQVSDYYLAMDAFALTSREDPFPLVMLEAGAAGLPVVCFANTGGGPEFIGEEAGLIAPYLDAQAFASHLLLLQENSGLRCRLGAQAARKVQTCHTVEKQAPKLWQCMEHCMQPA